MSSAMLTCHVVSALSLVTCPAGPARSQHQATAVTTNITLAIHQAQLMQYLTLQICHILHQNVVRTFYLLSIIVFRKNSFSVFL